MSLSQAVQEAIQKDLPGLAANELKTFIAEAEQTKQRLANTMSALEGERNRVKELEATLASHRLLAEREQAVDAAEKKLQKAEIEMLKREAKMEAAVAQSELTGVKDTMAAFLKNPTIRTTVISDVSKPLAGSPGGNGYQGSPGVLARNYDGKPDTTTTETEQQ